MKELTGINNHPNSIYHTKLEIPPIEKKVDQPIIKPLTNKKKEEDYEVQLNINTFSLDDTIIGEINPL